MRFTIRELVLVTVIVAMAFGWWIDRRRLAHRLQLELSQTYELYSHSISHPVAFDTWLSWPASKRKEELRWR
jgi:hypothetical protein